MSAQQVTVSKMNLMIYKAKKKSATKGYELLKKKLDALKKKMRDMQKVLLEKKQLLTKSFDKAFMSYAESEWAAGAFDKKVEEIVSKKAEVGLELRGDNVAGVFLPTFILKRGNDNAKKISRMQGAIAIQKTREM